MTQLVNTVLAGFFGGCILALLGTGYSLVYSSTGVLNLAQGAFVVLGAMITYSLRANAHWPLPLAVAGALLAVVVLSAILHRAVIGPSLQRLSGANVLMLMGGLLIALQGLATVVWGSSPVALAPFTSPAQLLVGTISVASQGLWITGLTVVLLILLWVFLGRSLVGKALRASAESPFSARLSGIPVERMSLLSYCASGAIGALAGSFVVPYNSLAPTSVLTYSLLGLVAVALGGLGSIYGAVAGGLVLGIADALIAGYVSTLFGDALSMGFLILVLVFRPQGLLSFGGGRRADTNTRLIGRIPVTPRFNLRVSRALLAALVIFMAVFPAAGMFATHMRTINLVGIFGLTVVGLDLLSGTAGQVSLGQGGFMAVGGYTAAYLMVAHHVSPLLGALAAIGASLAVAAIFGLLVRRLSGMYLATVTLAFGILAEQLANGFGFLGGSGGLDGVPSFSVAGFSFGTDTRFFYLIWALVLVASVVVARLNRSQWGRLLKSLHGDPIATSVVGYNVARGKMVALMLSAVMAGLSGELYACYFHYLSPDMVGSAESLSLITMVVVGGAGTVAGPILGSALFTFLPSVFASIALYFTLVQGLLLVTVLRVLPSGIFGGLITASGSLGTAVTRRRGRMRIPSRPQAANEASVLEGEMGPRATVEQPR